MTRVLVTGGTGGLGSEVVNKLIKAGYQVRVMSRHNRQPGQWPEADNAGVTLEDATLSTFISKALLRHDGSVDVQGTRLLLEYARNAGVGHFIYISIVGVEQIPFAYYRHKLQAETLIQDSVVP